MTTTKRATGLALGDWLREHGITQDECAEGAGVSQTCVSYRVQRRERPLAETVDRIVAYARRVERAHRTPRSKRLDPAKLHPLRVM